MSKHVETECTGNTTILALCQDVRHCMLGKRALLAVTLPLPYPYIYIFINNIYIYYTYVSMNYLPSMSALLSLSVAL